MQVGQCSFPNQFFVLYGLANAVDPDYCSAPYRSANVVLKSFLRAIQVGQCSWPKSLLRAIPVGRIRYLSMPYRSANAVGPIHFSVSYGLAGYDPICVIQVGQCSWPKSFLRAIQVGQIQYLSMPYIFSVDMQLPPYYHVAAVSEDAQDIPQDMLVLGWILPNI